MIDIGMSTYNGEKYVVEQLDSILNQTFHDYEICIRDDVSSDKTVEVIENYANVKHLDINLIKATHNLGAKESFMELLRQSKNEYLMFCDQDDYWINSKLEITMKKMNELEEQFGTESPLLVFTDMKVVDNDLTTIDESFCNYMKINPYETSLGQLLSQNKISGCVMMINKPLIELSKKKIIGYYGMHDEWIGLVAATFGHIAYVDKPTSLYRQHSNNEVGASKASTLKFYSNGLKKAKLVMKRHREVAQSLLNTYGDSISSENKMVLTQYVNLANMNIFKKHHILKKNNMYTGTLPFRIAQLLY